MRMLTLRQVTWTVGIGLALTSMSGSWTTVHAQSPQAAALDRSLLDQYCVTCHNERLQTGGLMLDTVDVNDLNTSAAVLEKVVRKLRRHREVARGR